MEGQKIGQGKANAAKYLEENPADAQALEQQIRGARAGVPDASSNVGRAAEEMDEAEAEAVA
ncbi:hypothetical protein [Stutzerimonas xanthomarina]|uniref:hypothetical protein n=1 Tax=Stutzerimonas xanthomarina TaxID=271420 RepID=UPI003918100E